MGLVITGVIIVGGVAPASVYDYIARRRGPNTSVSLTWPRANPHRHSPGKAPKRLARPHLRHTHIVNR
jgi:hypothetical protein